MDTSRNPLHFGFLLGRWFSTSVRVSVWFILIPIVFCVRLGLELGMTISVLLFVSILIHEFFHVFAARLTGGSGDEILMWPLGGLAFVSPAPNFVSDFWTAAAGPISNALLCLVTLPMVLSEQALLECLSPIFLPSVELTRATIFRDLCLLLFSLNFKLTILNLLPCYPLDGWRMTFAVTKQFWERPTAHMGTLWSGLVVCMILLVIGLAKESTDLVFLGSLLMIMGFQEYTLAQIAQRFGELYEPENEYEYSSLYEDDEPKLSPFERWRRNRADRRREKEELQRLQNSRRVDELLEKVHKQGLDSLSEAERRFLKNASTKYRSPD